MSKRLPALFFVFLFGWFASLAAKQPADLLSPKFEGDVRDYTYRSLDNPPIPGCSLFIGSSSFRIWGKKLEEAFVDIDAVNRGFGGSKFPDNIAVLDRIHLPYHPKRITIFCGTNDIAGGADAETVFENFKYYIARHWNENPLAEIYFVSTTHAPSREKFWPAGDQLCTKVKELASKTKGLYYIDIIAPMEGENGRVREELFVKDRLHLNEDGYKIWTDAFKKAFEEQDKVRTKLDVRELFRNRKELGLFDDPRFAEEGIKIKEPAEKDLNLNVVFLGDSITHGAGLKENTPPKHCVDYLKEQAGIGKIDMFNLGVSGYTTVDFLPATKKQFPKVQEVADKLKDDKEARLVFSIMLGTNDSAIKGPNGSPVSQENYRKNLKTIIDKLLADYPGSQIVIHRPIWYSPNTQNRSEYLLEGQLRSISYQLEIESLVDYYRLSSDKGRVFLGDTKGFAWFKTNFEKGLAQENGVQGTFYLHPNGPGAEVLGRFWGEAIRQAVQTK